MISTIVQLHDTLVSANDALFDSDALYRQHPATRVIAVSSGKGGVGKTNVVVNLAVALSRRGEDVMVLDGDLGLSNVNVLLGVNARRDISHVLRGDASLEEIIIDAPEHIRVVPGASGVTHMARLGDAELAAIVHAFADIKSPPSVLLVDSEAGLSRATMQLNAAAHEIVVVLCDEPAAITDAYAYMKCMRQEYGKTRFHVLPNMVDDNGHGLELFKKLTRVADRSLDVSLNFLGAIPSDQKLRDAVRAQRVVCTAFPRSRSASAFYEIANHILRWPEPTLPSGRLEFFVERMLTREFVSLEVTA
jgi:flagellar biosynthesis protein FlhG